jgi:mono/diheme cytochrome c family protein
MQPSTGFMPAMKIAFTAALGLVACTSSPTSTGFEINSANGHELSAVAGDALALQVVETFSDGSTKPATGVTWVAPITVVPLDPDSMADSPIPAFGAAPTAVFVDNTLRTDRDDDDLTGVLFALDAGSAPGGMATATAMVGSAMATVSIPIAATPAGNATNGAKLYTAGCSDCHGTMAQGTPANTDGSFTIDGNPYAFPAPGLDTEDGNLASDPGWNAALLAMSARTDMDNGGLELRFPMPDWNVEPVSGSLLSTQDFADIYAFLMTQPAH